MILLTNFASLLMELVIHDLKIPIGQIEVCNKHCAIVYIAILTCGVTTKNIISNDTKRFIAQSQRRNVKYDATLEPNFPTK